MKSACYKFGDYELDGPRFELRRSGRVLKLERIPMELLILLAERDGEVVARQDISERLWGKDVFVDTEHGINTAVRKIRSALQEDAEQPRFIQTVPGKGYRFCATATDLIRANGRGTTSLEGSRIRPQGVPLQHYSADVHSVEATPVGSAAGNRWRGLKIASIAAGLVAALTAALSYPRLHPQGESNLLAPIPVTAFPGLEVVPTFSPDGSQIAFAWNGDPAPGTKGYDLYAKVVGNESLLRLTNHASEEIDAAWSPDGTQIAFYRSAGVDSGIYTVPALGGPERKLRSTEVLAVPAPINWSHDGKIIAFADAPLPDGHRRLFLLSLDTLAATQISHADQCLDEMYAAFSPQAPTLAYVCYLQDGGFGVFSVDVPSGIPRLITTFPGWAWGITWAGDGKRLLLSLDKRGAPDDELVELSLADAAVRTLPFGQHGKWPTVSRRGDRMAFVLKGAHCSLWRRSLGHPESSALHFIPSTQDQFYPQYSPDGKHVAFTSNRSGTPEIWVSDADGTNLAQISDLKNPATGSERWSPDGRKLVFDSGRFADANLYIADILERLPRKIATGIQSASAPSWSRDGRWIYFVGDGKELGGKIYRCPAGGGRAEIISEQLGYGPVESVDGESVYFAQNVGGKWLLKTVVLAQPAGESAVEGMPPIFFQRTGP